MLQFVLYGNILDVMTSRMFPYRTKKVQKIKHNKTFDQHKNDL